MKRTGSLRRVSKRNSNRWKDEDYRWAYLSQIKVCELSGIFPDWQEFTATGMRDVIDPHHICGSMNGARRWDVLTNLIGVCRPVHDWIGDNLEAGWWLCARVKIDKGEWSTIEMNRILGLWRPGASCVGLLSMRPVTIDWVLPIKESVIADIERGA